MLLSQLYYNLSIYEKSIYNLIFNNKNIFFSPFKYYESSEISCGIFVQTLITSGIANKTESFPCSSSSRKFYRKMNTFVTSNYYFIYVYK